MNISVVRNVCFCKNDQTWFPLAKIGLGTHFLPFCPGNLIFWYVFNLKRGVNNFTFKFTLKLNLLEMWLRVSNFTFQFYFKTKFAQPWLKFDFEIELENASKYLLKAFSIKRFFENCSYFGEEHFRQLCMYILQNLSLTFHWTCFQAKFSNFFGIIMM